MSKLKNDIDILENEIKRLRKYQPKDVSQRRARSGLDRKVIAALKKLKEEKNT